MTMTGKEKVLEILSARRGSSVSGEELAEMLNVSRTAVWKSINALRREGYVIDAIPNKGYCLAVYSDALNRDTIESFLRVDAKVKVLGKVESTNLLAAGEARDGAPAGTVVIANEQSAGRGRRGRGFYSPPGTGLYMSFVLKPTFDISQGILITTAASLAVARALQKVCDVSPKIKWVNDVYVDDKKVCGILTEGITDLETGEISHLIVGIGLNCYTEDFPKEAGDLAGSIGSEFSRNRLAAQVINELLVLSENLGSRKFMKEYRELSMIIGEKIQVYKGDKVFAATALDIDQSGGLIVKYDNGKEETLSTGEVTIRRSK